MLIQQGLHRLTKKIIQKKIKMKSWNYMNQYNHRIRIQLEKRKKRITRVLISSNFIDGKSHVRILAFPFSSTPSSRRCIGLLGVLFYFSKKKKTKWKMNFMFRRCIFTDWKKKKKVFFIFPSQSLKLENVSLLRRLFSEIFYCARVISNRSYLN